MTVTLTLPFPISVNAMFADGKIRRHKSQRYCDWLLEAGYALNRQKPDPIKGQFKITYELQEGHDKRERDAFNFEKGISDLLVAHGIIEGDSGKYLRDGRVTWNSEVEGVRITIEPLFNRVPETKTPENANVREYRR
jgi:crossover junction endodeoxyribonuclease RusA